MNNIYGLPIPINQLYYNRYIKLIEFASKQNINTNYEIHHILPKSMNGTNDRSNLIKLTYRQHYIAHWLLWKAYQNKQMIAAFWFMTNQRSIISSRIYESLRDQFSKSISGKNNYFYGKHFKGIDSPSYGIPKTEKFKKQRSIDMTGERNHFYGKSHSEEIKKEISKIAKKRWEDPAYRQLQADKISNREKIQCPHCKINTTRINAGRVHFDKCKHNPNYIPNILICPHCNFEGDNKCGHMTRYHFNNCRKR